MAEKKRFASRFRLVYRRSSPLLKCIVLAMVVLSTVALLTVSALIRDANASTEALRLQAAMEEARKVQLLERLDKLGTVESTKQIASEELGLVDENSVILTPTDHSK